MEAIKKHIKKYMYLRTQKKHKAVMSGILEGIDFTPIENIKPTKVDTITFVLPGMIPYSGGHTSVLRLGTELSKKGYKVRYTSFIVQTKEDMMKNAAINLSNYEGEMIEWKDISNVQSDVVIATSWETVYYSKKLSGYKMYFIQDYEPYFNLYGESFILAQKTYGLGLHMVSLGPWNKHMIETNCNPLTAVDYITFPYEGKEYYPKERNFADYKNRKEFTIAVFIKDVGKRAPYLLQNIVVNLKEQFKKDGIDLNFKYYGENKEFQCDGGENLGKLNKEQLLNLYHEADFGMVASLTNISLVPYEMIATGLPIIEFEEGTFNYFFPQDSAIMTTFDYKVLYSNLKEAINNPDKIKEMNNTANKYIGTLSWQNSVNEFDEILKGIISV